MRRHDLITVSPSAWRSLLAARQDLAEEPLVAGWVDRGWPLVIRRLQSGEADAAVPLGLPLPPAQGRRRLFVLMQPGDVVSQSPPPLLSAAAAAAPEAWRPTLEQVTNLVARYGLEARVFGSLAWSFLTGLEYLTASSDLDLLIPLPGPGDLSGLTAGLARIESAAPMRLDGELVREDGAGVNWREFHVGAREVLVKTPRAAVLRPANDFAGGTVRP